MINRFSYFRFIGIATAMLTLSACGPKPGEVLGEALRGCLAHPPLSAEKLSNMSADAIHEYCRAGTYLHGSVDPFLKDMDRGLNQNDVALKLKDVAGTLPFSNPKEAWESYNRGRNNWVMWTAGNDTLWDFLSNNTFGTFDLLKIISSHPSIQYCTNEEPYNPVGSNYYGRDGDDEYNLTYGVPFGENYGYDGVAPYPEGYWVYDYDSKSGCISEQGEKRGLRMTSRENRWKYFGLVNEPGYKMWQPPPECLEQDTSQERKKYWEDKDKVDQDNLYGRCGNPDRFGLWLDMRTEGPDPFEDASKYPGVRVGGRGVTKTRDGKVLPVGSYYGYGTGIVGLRIFPNPDFDEEAAEKWDPVAYYNNEDYYQKKDLVRPYRVGMSCGFCHVGPSPIKPPEDFENPEWANLTSNPGAQYFWLDRIFYWNPDGRHENFIYQLFRTSLPGSLDTSLISSDNINNPRTMNAVYSIAARLGMAKFHPEKLAGGGLNNKQFNDYEQTQAFNGFFAPPDQVLAAHVLKDGSDSVGILGALNRVYLNIGLFSEEWLLHFQPLIGNLPLKRITPIEIEVLERNSAFWNSNVTQTPDLALFFVTSAQPDHLEDVEKVCEVRAVSGSCVKYYPNGAEYLQQRQEEARIKGGFETADACPDNSLQCTINEMLGRGKMVFADNCARCHSGKQPELCQAGQPCNQGGIREDSAAYYEWMRAEVAKPDFLVDNFLSTERRVPVTELGTNACSPLATNGVGGDIWDNFTSQTYKELPAVGKYTVHHPKNGEPWEYQMPGDGRGYTRPASLISLWSTGPYLLNNSVGTFYGAATTEDRLASFEDSIGQMLWPERRHRDAELGDKVPGYIQRTTADSYLNVPMGYLPKSVLGWPKRLAPWAFDEREGGLLLGPIPKGTAVGLLANLPFVSDSTRFRDKADHFLAVKRFLLKAIGDLKKLDMEDKRGDPLTAEERARVREIFGNLVDDMVGLSKCPDYVVNRGHYFGSNLSDRDKLALIEFLRTF